MAADRTNGVVTGMSWPRSTVASLISRAAPALIRLGGRQLRILNYHRILEPPADFLLDADVVSATPEVFDAEMAFCKRHFDIVSCDDVAAALDDGPRLPRRPLVVTFDDGYRDNYEQAFPILRRHGLTATFCIAVDYADSDRLFWWDQVACSVHLNDAHLPRATRLATIRRVLRTLKAMPDGERLAEVTEYAARIPAATAQAIGRQTMTWDEIRALVAGGMTIASHSMSHPILSRVDDPRALDHELRESKRVLERETGRPVAVFSYPVGGAGAINDIVRGRVEAAGYRFALSYVNGFNDTGAAADRFGLRRLHVDGLNLRQFRRQLAWAG